MKGPDKMIPQFLTIHNRAAGWLASGQSAFLLILRLYWGWQLMVSGWNKFANFTSTVRYFEGLGLPAAEINASLAGVAELGGGLLLLIGLLSRPAAAVLTINFIIAYIFGHPDAARALFSQPAEFIDAPAFTYLFVSILVLLFGPGRISIDAWLMAKFRDRIEPPPKAVSEQQGGMSRREAGVLAGAALAGVVAGFALPRTFGGSDGEQAAAAGDSDEASSTQEGAETAGEGQAQGTVDVAEHPALQEVNAQAPSGVIPTLLLTEPHVCCGLNTCRGLGKKETNDCAGQGTCATAETHVCQGLNECKGQGGCGQYPGQNECSGKGACAVPLDKKQWKIARERFEELMGKAGRSVGEPPESCEQSG